MQLASLDLDLEVFQGPFDLLLALVLREEVDLLEVDLAEIVLTYIDHLEQAGELDLEAATEFLVLIAALLELKSRMMLPREEEDGLDMEPSTRATAARPDGCASGSRTSTASGTALRRFRPS
jgi:segregation and condensation protein A